MKPNTPHEGVSVKSDLLPAGAISKEAVLAKIPPPVYGPIGFTNAKG